MNHAPEHIQRIYYFGCGSFVGHAWFGPMLTPISSLERRALDKHFGRYIDGKFAPAYPHTSDGDAKLSHTNDWTILAWWDRSQDRRKGSNSALVISGHHSLEQMLTLLQQHFPTVSKRQNAPICLVEPAVLEGAR